MTYIFSKQHVFLLHSDDLYSVCFEEFLLFLKSLNKEKEERKILRKILRNTKKNTVKKKITLKNSVAYLFTFFEEVTAIPRFRF